MGFLENLRSSILVIFIRLDDNTFWHNQLRMHAYELCSNEISDGNETKFHPSYTNKTQGWLSTGK